MTSRRDGGLGALFRKMTDFDWTIVETGGTTPGVSDHNYCIDGVEGWVEMKQTRTYRVNFEQFQPQWIHRRVRHGGNVWIAVRRWHDGGPRRGDPVDQLWMFAGRDVLELADNGMSLDIAAGMWGGGPHAWGWRAVHGLLRRPQAAAGDCALAGAGGGLVG